MHKLDEKQRAEVRATIIAANPYLLRADNPINPKKFPFEVIFLRTSKYSLPHTAGMESLVMDRIRNYVGSRCFDSEGEPVESHHLHFVFIASNYSAVSISNAQMRLGEDFASACGLGSVTLIDADSQVLTSASHAHSAALPFMRALSGTRWKDGEGSLLGEEAGLSMIRDLLATIQSQQNTINEQGGEIHRLKERISHG